MAILTKEQIFAAEDVPTKIVPVPKWGGEVKISSMTVGMRRKIREMIADAKDGDPADEYLFVSCVVEPSFMLDDLPALRAKDAATFKIVVDAILGLLKESEEATAAAVQHFPGSS